MFFSKSKVCRYLQKAKELKIVEIQINYPLKQSTTLETMLKEKYQLMEAYNMTLEAAATKLMWVLGQTRDSEEVRRLFYQPVQWDIIR